MKSHPPGPSTTAKNPFGPERITVTFFLALLTALGLKAALYFRPGPFGAPFSTSTWFGFAGESIFEGFGLAIISLPFFAHAYFRAKRGAVRLRISGTIHAVVCFVSLLISHSDHETRRFMGIRLSVNYLKTYARIGDTPVAIGHAITDDMGGSLSAYLLLLVPVGFLVLALTLGRTLTIRPRFKHAVWLAASFGLLFAVTPAVTLISSPPDSPVAKNLRPPILLIQNEIKSLLEDSEKPPDIHELSHRYQEMWTRGDDRGSWDFNVPGYPLRKTLRNSRATECEGRENPMWNFILLQLETFRAKDMALFNPGLGTVPTPYLDELARDEKSAYWTRFYGNGIPTVYSFMAIQTGLLPHTEKAVAIAFEDTRLEGISSFLRKSGYVSAFFSGPNPDWDNETHWLQKWYDHVVFRSEYNEEDRPLFREAADYLKQHAQNGPFFVAVASITNHVPFRSPEPGFSIAKDAPIIDRLRNTMAYTDDVVREFVSSIRNEPWFDRTILIITGDHGYDLGDRGAMIGHSNLRHETTWVPLIIHGNHPCVSKGKHTGVGSHIDLAPTILELAGRRDDNSFMGHSLIDANPSASTAAAFRDKNAMLETLDFSAYFPLGADPMLFGADDPNQLTDISRANGSILHDYRSRLETLMEITDWAYEENRVVPPKN